ncbi:MAG: hypothetical protein K6A35_04975 [bacterium]|nr:hypothetical protein [bacterium]
MACKLIDVHHYGRYARRPKIPRDPLCLPLKAHEENVRRKIVAIAAMFAFLFAFAVFCGGTLKESGLSWVDAVVTVAVAGGTVYYIANIEEKLYAKLQDPRYNPQGCQYQGRILSTNEPHYRLHLDYYNTYGTWTLPDELEHSAD